MDDLTNPKPSPLVRYQFDARMNRRMMLKRAAAIGFATPMLASLLAACGGDDDDDDTADATATTATTAPTATGPSPTVATSGATATTSGSTAATEWYIDDNPGPPQPGGMLQYLLYEDPDSLNPIVGATSISLQVITTILEPLAETAPDGSWVPILAVELPGRDNGGVSEDLLTVTWKLREGVLWHDGEPFTSADVTFTWEAASSVEGGSAVATSYELIESIDTPDDLTVIVNYSAPNVGYLDQFPWILPQHATGDVTDMLNWDFNRAPVGTGPFVFEEWEAADHVTVLKNEDYREEGKPYLDGMNFLVVPSEESRAAQMLQGDAHIMLWPGESSSDQFESSEVVKDRLAPGIWVTQLRFNLSMPYDDDPGAEPPHPILGDVKVRQAITMAVNRDRINTEILNNLRNIDSPLSVGWILAEVEPFKFDPDGAKALLEEAGWVEGPDGVRVAQGAPNAEDGTTLELLVNGYTGFDPIEKGELAIQEDLAAVGIKMNIENQDFAIIFGTWEDGSPRLLGDYDMLYYDSGFFIEPHDAIRSNYHPTQVPSADNPAGDNVYRWVRQDVGEAIDAAGATVDIEERRASYQKVADALREDIPTFPVQQFNEGSAYSTKLHGFTVSTWEWSTWDCENWWLEQEG
jgi:peptide/nickel transport system substrate-binding protein